jgi:hypothetical protein
MGKSLKYAIEPESPRAKKPDEDEHRRFVETARELGYQEADPAVDEALRGFAKISAVKPKTKSTTSQ